jgi:hypothetical protein
MNIGLHVVYLYSCPILMKIDFLNIFEKYSNMKFHENLFIGTPPSCSMRTDRRTDTTKLIIAFRNFAKVLKNAALGAESNNILRTVEEHWLKNTVSDLSSLECSAMSLGHPHTMQSVADLVSMGSAPTFHVNITDKPQTGHKDACVQICVAKRRGFFLRNASLSDFVVVRTS